MNDEKSTYKQKIPSQTDPNTLGCLQNLPLSNLFHPIHTPKNRINKLGINIPIHSVC